MADESNDPTWQKLSAALPAGHKWQCKPGNHLFVADRGAVSFEIPQKWVTIPDEDGTIRMHDRRPPKDHARITLTLFHLRPVRGGWGQLPLERMFRFSLDQDETKAAQLDIKRLPRIDAEVLWIEHPLSPDTKNGKMIRCRQLMARANLVQPFITFEFYEEDSRRFLPVWTDLLRTLKVGVPRDITGETTN